MARGGGKFKGGRSTKTFKNNKNYQKKTGYKKHSSDRYMKVKQNIEMNKESEDYLKRQQIGKNLDPVNSPTSL